MKWSTTKRTAFLSDACFSSFPSAPISFAEPSAVHWTPEKLSRAYILKLYTFGSDRVYSLVSALYSTQGQNNHLILMTGWGMEWTLPGQELSVCAKFRGISSGCSILRFPIDFAIKGWRHGLAIVGWKCWQRSNRLSRVRLVIVFDYITQLSLLLVVLSWSV